MCVLYLYQSAWVYYAHTPWYNVQHTHTLTVQLCVGGAIKNRIKYLPSTSTRLPPHSFPKLFLLHLLLTYLPQPPECGKWLLPAPAAGTAAGCPAGDPCWLDVGIVAGKREAHTQKRWKKKNLNISGRGNTAMGLTLTIISRGTVHDNIACRCGGLPSWILWWITCVNMYVVVDYLCGYYVGGFLASRCRSFFYFPVLRPHARFGRMSEYIFFTLWACVFSFLPRYCPVHHMLRQEGPTILAPKC